jgi:cysteine desulfurase
MLPWLEVPANASSVHRFGRVARVAIEQAREAVAKATGTTAASVFFTASGTEANNWALRGLDANTTLVSAVEHPSVWRAVTGAQRIPVDRSGEVNRTALETMLQQSGPGTLVSVMWVQNETGVIQPIAEIADLVHRHGGMLHCDAAQGFGKLPLSIPELGADLVTLCAHKMGGPVGAAALIVNGCLPLLPLMRGGGQERNQRAGTENVMAIAGFAAACGLLSRTLPQIVSLAAARDAMEARLTAQGAEVIGKDSPRVATTSCIRMPGVSFETQLMQFDLAGLAVSAGSACTSGRMEASPALQAMGFSHAEASEVVRVSAGWASTTADFERFAACWEALYQRTQTQRSAA